MKNTNLSLVQDGEGGGGGLKKKTKNGYNPGSFRSLLHMAVLRGRQMSASLLLFNTDERLR